MIAPTADTSATSLEQVAGATSTPNKPLDREAFLKLLVAQISHQDPLKPMEGTEFVAQLSQFAVVEQAIAQSTHLETLSTQIRGVSNQGATDLVGKRVTMRGNVLAFDGVTATKASATLEGSAAKVTAEIVDSNGKIVRSIEMGARPSGPLTVTWDGNGDNGTAAPKGSYSMRLRATTADGKAIPTTQDVSGSVVKVTFEKGYPELTLDNGATGPISDLVAVEAGQPQK